jgi:hypothetical protein
MSNFINNLLNGDLEGFRKNIFDTLYAKAGEQLDDRKVEIANNLYSTTEQEADEIEETEE